MSLCKPDEYASNIPGQNYDIVTTADWHPLSGIQSSETKLNNVREERSLNFKIDIYGNGQNGII